MDNRHRPNRPSTAQPVVTPAGNGRWKVLLALSLAANLALGVTAWRAAQARPAAGAAIAKVAVAPPTPVPAAPAKAAADPVYPRELRAYAALGTFLAENNHIPSLQWSQDQFDAFLSGVRSSFEGRGYAVDEDAVALRDQISAKVQAMTEANAVDPIEDYFATLREKEGVKRLESGLHYRITEEGHGEKPLPESSVVLSYTARLPDGKTLPVLSRPRVRSAVSDLLPGIAEGVQLLPPGGKALLYLPPSLSFRDGPWPQGVPAGAPLIFFIELHEVLEE